MLPAETRTVVDLRELLRMPGGIAAVNGYLTGHVPHGLVAGEAGQAGNVRLPAPTAYYVDYNPRHMPRGIYDATLGVAVVPAHGGGSLVRIDAQVAWYPRRSAAEHIDQRHYRAVKVTAPRHNGSTRLAIRTFAARRVIARLARLVNGLPAMPAVSMSCWALTSESKLTFIPAATRWPPIVVTPGCGGAGIRVGGHDQPALDYTRSALIATMDRLLGLPDPSGL